MTLPGHRKCRVIAVEDEALVLLLLQDMLTELGCEIAGSATRLDSALRLAIDGEFDLAILDVNLHGKRIDPIADAIAGRGLPIIFVTRLWRSLSRRTLGGTGAVEALRNGLVATCAGGIWSLYDGEAG